MTGTKVQQQRTGVGAEASVEQSLTTAPSVPLANEVRRLLDIMSADKEKTADIGEALLAINSEYDRSLAA